MRNDFHHIDEPTAADLAAIEAEQPLLDAELAWLDAELTLLNAAERGSPEPLDRRRVRRAEARVIRESFAFVASAIPVRADPHMCKSWRWTEVGMTDDCKYGCKVIRCSDCGTEQVEHRSIYGCPLGRAA